MEVLRLVLGMLLAASLVALGAFCLAWQYQRGRRDGIDYAINELIKGAKVTDRDGKLYTVKVYRIEDA